MGPAVDSVGRRAQRLRRQSLVRAFDGWMISINVHDSVSNADRRRPPPPQPAHVHHNSRPTQRRRTCPVLRTPVQMTSTGGSCCRWVTFRHVCDVSNNMDWGMESTQRLTVTIPSLIHFHRARERWRRSSPTTRRSSWSGGGKWGCFDERSGRTGGRGRW
jgi:hypothetical protein